MVIWFSCWLSVGGTHYACWMNWIVCSELWHFKLLIVAILDNDMSIMISITIQVLHVLHFTAGCFFFRWWNQWWNKRCHPKGEALKTLEPDPHVSASDDEIFPGFKRSRILMESNWIGVKLLHSFNMVWKPGKFRHWHVCLIDFVFSFQNKQELVCKNCGWPLEADIRSGCSHTRWPFGEMSYWGLFCGKWQRRHADFSGINIGASEHCLEGDVVYFFHFLMYICVTLSRSARSQAFFFDASGFLRKNRSVSCHKDLYI